MTSLWIMIASALFSAVNPDLKEVISIEIYNRDQALIREVRQVDLAKGKNIVDFQKIAEGIYGHTTLIKPLKAADKITTTNVIYNYDLLSHDKLLSNFIGRWFTFGTDDMEYEGKLLRIDDDYVFIQPDTLTEEIEVIERGELVKTFFPRLPEGLFIEPTLRWTIEATKKFKKLPVEISYLTSDLSWMCDYRAKLLDDKTVELSAVFTIDNQLPISFPDAEIALVAGWVHRSSDPENVNDLKLSAGRGSKSGDVESEKFFEYYRYTLPKPVDLGRNQTIQLPFFEPLQVKVNKKFVYPHTLTGGQVQIRLKINNSVQDGLGKALPEGDVGIYRETDNGILSFIGEDFITATPVGGEIEVNVGAAFNLTARRTRIGQSRPQRDRHEETWRVEIISARSDTSTVEVEQRVFGYYNVIMSEVNGEKVEYEPLAADRIMFPVTVMPYSKSELVFSLSFGY